MLSEAESIFDELRAEWERRVGAVPLAKMEALLWELVGGESIHVYAARWMGPGAGS